MGRAGSRAAGRPEPVSVAEEGATPSPYVLDLSVLAAIARADTQAGTLLQSLDERNQQVTVPALAITGASLGAPGQDAGILLEGLELFGIVTIAPLQGMAQSMRLAEVIARTGLDPWDAHVAAVADASGCRILTLDGARWRRHEHDLGERLHYTEIEDPGEGA